MLCPAGTYADNTGFKKCIPCPYRLSSTEGSSTCSFCDDTFYLVDGNITTTVLFSDPSEHCLNCPNNTSCDANIDVQGIELNEGFWRLSKNTATIYPCTADSNACVGSIEDTVGYCKEGHSGPLCTVCLENNQFFSFTEKQCINCPAIWAQLLIIVGGIAFMTIIAYIIKRNVSLSFWYDLATTIGLKEKTKLLVSFYQIFAAFDDVYGVRLSNVLPAWANILNILSFDLIQVLPLDCILSSTQQRLITLSLSLSVCVCVSLSVSLSLNTAHIVSWVYSLFIAQLNKD